jgi:Ca-activated chloride channel family protein
MLAEDVAPNRLERAKSDIKDLLDRLAGDRAGLIVFAGAASIQVPLTTDHQYFRDVLDEVDVRAATIGGSLIGDAIRKALQAMKPRPDTDQVIVLITDGDDHDSFPEEAARQAAARGVRIFAVGIGDAIQGARIPVRDSSKRSRFVEENGREVWSKLNEELLKRIAQASGGSYIPARTRTYDLGQIYDEHLGGLNRGQFHSQLKKQTKEQFQIFLVLGVVCLLADLALAQHSLRER